MACRTKDKIKSAFLEMLKDKNLSDITVVEVTEKCGVNRNTFYYHYKDIPVLMEEILTDCAYEILAKYPSLDSLEECLYAILDFMENNRNIFLHIYRSLPRIAFEKYLWKLCRCLVENYWNASKKTYGDKLSERDQEVLKEFFVCAFFGLAIDCINNGSSVESYRQGAHRLAGLLSRFRAGDRN